MEMKRLQKLGQQHGFQVIVVYWRGQPKDAMKVARRLGFHRIDTHEVFKEFMREHDIEEYRGSVLTTSRHDPHPSKLAHRMISEIVLNRLTATKSLGEPSSPGAAASIGHAGIDQNGSSEQDPMDPGAGYAGRRPR